jgi:hypothetical protein
MVEKSNPLDREAWLELDGMELSIASLWLLLCLMIVVPIGIPKTGTFDKGLCGKLNVSGTWNMASNRVCVDSVRPGLVHAIEWSLVWSTVEDLSGWEFSANSEPESLYNSLS